jgi:hypothetical protein
MLPPWGAFIQNEREACSIQFCPEARGKSRELWFCFLLNNTFPSRCERPRRPQVLDCPGSVMDQIYRRKKRGGGPGRAASPVCPFLWDPASPTEEGQPVLCWPGTMNPGPIRKFRPILRKPRRRSLAVRLRSFVKVGIIPLGECVCGEQRDHLHRCRVSGRRLRGSCISPLHLHAGGHR